MCACPAASSSTAPPPCSSAGRCGRCPRQPLALPVDPVDIATHVLWKVEARPDIINSIPHLVTHVGRCGTSVPLGCGNSGAGRNGLDVGDDAERQDLGVRSIFALTNIAYNHRLRDRVLSNDGFLELLVSRAIESEEPSYQNAYLGLLYRLTFRLPWDGLGLLSAVDAEKFLSWLVSHVLKVQAATTADTNVGAIDPAPLLGVFANLVRNSLAARAFVKGQSAAPQLYAALATLLAGPGVLCMVLALQALAALVLDEALGATLFGEDTVSRVFGLIFSLVKEADHNDHAHHALRAAADLLEDLFRNVRVLQVVDSLGGIAFAKFVDLLGAIVAARHTYDSELPLLELASALLRPAAIRTQLQNAFHDKGAKPKTVGAPTDAVNALSVLLELAAAPHADVAHVAAEVARALSRDMHTFGHTLNSNEQDRILDRLVQAADLCSGDSSSVGVAMDSRSCFLHFGTEVVSLPNERFAHARRRCAACALLGELARTNTFADVVRQRLKTAPFIRAIDRAAAEGSGRLLLTLLLLALQMREDAGLSARRELLLYARSPSVVAACASTLGTSSNMDVLHDCLLLVHRLYKVLDEIEATAPGDPSTDRLDLIMFAAALAKQNASRDQELERVSAELRRTAAARQEDANRAQKLMEKQQQRQGQLRGEAVEAKKHVQEELLAVREELQAERCTIGALECAVGEKATAAVKVSADLNKTEGQLHDCEVTCDELAQRAERAEGVCAQLGGQLQMKKEQLDRALFDRDRLLCRLDEEQPVCLELAAARESERQAQIDRHEICMQLQSEGSALMQARSDFGKQINHLRAEGEEDRNAALAAAARASAAEDGRLEAERHAALLRDQNHDLERQILALEARLQAAAVAREDAQREATWRGCELAAEHRLRRDRQERREAVGREYGSSVGVATAMRTSEVVGCPPQAPLESGLHEPAPAARMYVADTLPTSTRHSQEPIDWRNRAVDANTNDGPLEKSYMMQGRRVSFPPRSTGRPSSSF